MTPGSVACVRPKITILWKACGKLVHDSTGIQRNLIWKGAESQSSQYTSKRKPQLCLCSICLFYTWFIVRHTSLPTLPGSWFINLSYGDVTQIYPVVLHSSAYKQNDTAALNWQRRRCKMLHLCSDDSFFFLTAILLKCLSGAFFLWLVCNASGNDQFMEHKYLYIQCTLCLAASRLSVSHHVYLAVWEQGHPFPCVLSLVQHQFKGSAAVIQGYSCGSKSRAACKNESCMSERENWNTFYSKGFFQQPAVRTVAVFLCSLLTQILYICIL